MVGYAQETQHEKILRGLAVGIAMVMYGRMEEADALIESLCRDKVRLKYWTPDESEKKRNLGGCEVIGTLSWSQLCLQTQSLTALLSVTVYDRTPSCGALECTLWEWPTVALGTTRPFDACYMSLWVFPVMSSSWQFFSGRQVYHAGSEAAAKSQARITAAGIIINMT